MITPTLNINGSSADDFIAPRLQAWSNLRDAIEALLKATPNGRDYGDYEQCKTDRKKHYDRIEAIDNICHEIYSEAIAIKNQGNGA
jgi:hypothetical protein